VLIDSQIHTVPAYNVNPPISVRLDLRSLSVFHRYIACAVLPYNGHCEGDFREFPFLPLLATNPGDATGYLIAATKAAIDILRYVDCCFCCSNEIPSGVARICCEEGQKWKLCHGALTMDFKSGCSSCSMTNSFVTNAVLIERAVKLLTSASANLAGYKILG